MSASWVTILAGSGAIFAGEVAIFCWFNANLLVFWSHPPVDFAGGTTKLQAGTSTSTWRSARDVLRSWDDHHHFFPFKNPSIISFSVSHLMGLSLSNKKTIPSKPWVQLILHASHGAICPAKSSTCVSKALCIKVRALGQASAMPSAMDGFSNGKISSGNDHEDHGGFLQNVS